LLYEVCLIQIGEPPALGRHGVDLAIEPGNLGGEQIVIPCLLSR
jgi:hypothetical protein